MNALPILRVLKISTAHITEQTNRALTENNSSVENVSFYPQEGGYLVWTGYMDGEMHDAKHFPPDLAGVVHFARRHQCEWVWLDCDADRIDALVQWEW